MADAIVRHRERLGEFRSIEEVEALPPVEALLSDLRDWLTV
jgi:DNA uptake protein ComE-like DNA-binding protein